MRIRADGEVDARASSHSSYNYDPEPVNLSDIGSVGIPGLGSIDLRERAWGPANGFVWVSDGSHAGRAAGRDSYFRKVPRGGLNLIPIEPNIDRLGRLSFTEGIAPPWRKPVYTDPENPGT